MIAQRDALLRLLQDDDPDTLALIRAELVRRGPGALPGFRSLLAEAPPPAANQLREVIAQIEAGCADAAFGDFCAAFGTNGDLEEAAWRLAATFFPDDGFNAQRALLDAWAAEVSRRLAKAETEIDRIETLVEYLGHEVGLRGNEEDYYNIGNFLLPEVIDTRLGIPITLSLIYILVGSRAGIEISGVGLPGHFLIRHGQHFFDPFHGGRRIGLDECRARLEQQNLPLAPEYFQPVPPALFLMRMLNNIRAIAERSDPPLAVKVAGWLDSLRSAAAPG